MLLAGGEEHVLETKNGACTKNFTHECQPRACEKSLAFAKPHPHPIPTSTLKTNNKDRQILFIQHEREESERGLLKKINLFVKKVVFVVNKTIEWYLVRFCHFFFKNEYLKQIQVTKEMEELQKVFPIEAHFRYYSNKRKAVWQNVK